MSLSPFASLAKRWDESYCSSHESRTLGDINASIFSPAEYTKSGMLISFNHQIDIKQHKISYFYDWNRFYRKADQKILLASFLLMEMAGLGLTMMGVKIDEIEWE